jgi:hypothetical protein
MFTATLMALWVSSCKSSMPVSFREFTLEEDSTIPITSISSGSLSRDGRLLLIVDAASGCAQIYNSQSGRLVRTFIPKRNFSDSLAIKGTWPRKDKHYVTSNQFFIRNPRNVVQSAFFLNDSEVIAIGVLECGLISNTSNERMVAGHTVVYRYSIYNERVSVYPVEWKDPLYNPQPAGAAYNPEEQAIILPVKINDKGSLRRGRLDSTFCIGYYDLTGHLRKFVPLTLPSELLTFLLQPYQLEPILHYAHGDVLIGYEMLQHFFVSQGSKRLEIRKISPSNDEFFRSVRAYHQSHGDVLMPWDSLFAYKPYFFINMISDSSGNYFVTSFERTSIKPWKGEWITQEYSSSGDLLEQTESKDGPLTQYRYVFYSGNHNCTVKIALAEDRFWKVRIESGLGRSDSSD